MDIKLKPLSHSQLFDLHKRAVEKFNQAVADFPEGNIPEFVKDILPTVEKNKLN